MHKVSRVALIAAILAASIGLVEAPASAVVEPPAGGAGIVYGFSADPTAASQRATEYLKLVNLYDEVGWSGESIGALNDRSDLSQNGYFNDRTSSVGNWGTGYDMCFYADANYRGRWLVTVQVA